MNRVRHFGTHGAAKNEPACHDKMTLEFGGVMSSSVEREQLQESLPTLVGRANEQDQLLGHLSAAIEGRGSLLLIGGEAGIGKTYLVQDLARQAAAAGILVLTGSCYDLSATPPYGPWIDLALRFPHEPGDRRHR